MQKEKDLVNLWEEMGASTGAFIGRFIGLNAQLGLNFLDTFLTPLKSVTPKGQMEPPPSWDSKEFSPAQGNAGIRTEVWQQMGLQYGQKTGEALGMAQDLLIETMNATVINPLAQQVKAMNQKEEEY